MPAKRAAIVALDPATRSALAWALASKQVALGETHRHALIQAIRNGAQLPDDPEERGWIADVLEGKLEPARGRGRPRKRAKPDFLRTVIEHGIAKVYGRWLEGFKRDRADTWLRAEAMRLRELHPEALVWRRGHDLGDEADRRAYEAALAELGAGSCPPRIKGGKTARELALTATMQERRAAWKTTAETPLTEAAVKRIITRARKSG